MDLMNFVLQSASRINCPGDEVDRMLSTRSISAVIFLETNFQGVSAAKQEVLLGLDGLDLLLKIWNLGGKISI